MFEIGDTVYCINNHYTINKPLSSLIINLDKDVPYTISNIFTYDITINELYHCSYLKERFISEKDYFTSKREEKIIHLKKLIKYKNYGEKNKSKKFCA